MHRCRSSGQYRLNFFSMLKGVWPVPRGCSIPPHVIAKGGGKGILQGRMSPFWLRKCGRGSHPMLSIVGGFHSVSFLLPSVISIVVLTINFLISFPCPVNCSYSKIKTCDLCLSAYNSPLHPIAGKGERREGASSSVI